MPAWRGALSWFALTPLLIALLGPDKEQGTLKLRHGFLLGYVCGILWYMGSCSWIYQTMYVYGGLPKPVAFGILILFSLYLGLYHALFGFLMVYIRRAFAESVSLSLGDASAAGASSAYASSRASDSRARSTNRSSGARSGSSRGGQRRRRRRLIRSEAGVRNALLLAPFFWVAVELARARITSFPWNLLGNSQVDNLFLTQIAPTAGVMAMSFVIVAVNAALASCVFQRGRTRYYLTIAAIIFAFAVQANGTLPFYEIAAEPSETAVLLQENLIVGAPAHAQRHLTPGEELQVFTADSLHPAHRIIDAVGNHRWSNEQTELHPSVIVWPEAPSHLQSNDPAFRAEVGDLAREEQAPVIAGSLGIDVDKAAPRGYYLFDSASLFDNHGNYAGRYDKIHLVPWGEYIPYKQFFSFAQKLTEGVGDMDRGDSRDVFDAGGHKYGIFVCYESIFGDEVRQFVKNGAQVLVNISDDGWYGESGAPWQHLNMARMRAIENNRWLLRATNTGVTTAIDPHGAIAFEAPRHIRGAFVFPFGFLAVTTFYTEHGDWFAWLCVLISASAAGLAAGVHEQLRPKPRL